MPGEEVESPIFAVPTEILIGLEGELGHVVACALGYIGPGYRASEAACKQDESQHTGVVPLVDFRGGRMYGHRPCLAVRSMPC